MAVLDIFLLMITICLPALIVVLVPTLVQTKRSARKIEVLLDSLNQDLPPLLRALTQTSEEIQTITGTINNQTFRTDQVISTAQDAADTLYVTTNLIKNSITPVFAQISGINAGVQAFLYFLNKPKKQY
ncbi:MAG: DUF948 domain-containing protein [Proteobacteria bacterium]|nr:DUF948 domain-containing protein [Pseudomonadota bacterium]MBU1715642.1 DUF948 domain-containing protein [Pseudomonadota bacterium]